VAGRARGNRLITIPISHFCEKARWALDRAQIPYTEERHVQGIHVAFALRAGGGRTVPVLVSPGGGVIPESAAIVRWVDGQLDPTDRLYPAGAEGIEATRIEAWLDAGLGPDGRLWMYESTLPMIDDLEPWIVDGTPRWERAALRSGSWALTPLIRRYLGVSAPNAVAARARVDAVFDEVAGLLRDGRPYLCGERFTAADLTFAALSAAVLIPAGYGSPLPPLDALPATMVTEVQRLRYHEAGAFAARLYDEHRDQVVARPGSPV
jgi:glutathione S-transferase